MSFDSSYQVLAVSFNESAEQIISGGIDNEIKCWDIRKAGLLYKMKGHTDCPTGLSLSPDGSFVASNAMDNTGMYTKIVFTVFIKFSSISMNSGCISFYFVCLGLH